LLGLPGRLVSPSLPISDCPVTCDFSRKFTSRKGVAGRGGSAGTESPGSAVVVPKGLGSVRTKEEKERSKEPRGFHKVWLPRL
jgi:hypothetical protein